MRIALISDLHGNAVALEAVLAHADRMGVDETICLGDVATLGPRPREVVGMLRDRGCRCILGNHDSAPNTDIGGEWVTEFSADPFVFRHEAKQGALPGEIVGHHHPKASIPTRGTTVSRPCFVTDSRRLAMPAFGEYTGGLDVNDPAIKALFPRGGRAFLLGKDRLYSFPLGAMRAAG